MLPEDARYTCQMALPGFGGAAQQLLKQAKVLIAGMGGLGCPAAQYLAAAGVGTLGVADYDTISISNLHRQILYTQEEAGQKKAAVAAKKLRQQNPHIEIVAHDVKIAVDNVLELVGNYDLVLDATDNFEARYLLNDACVIAGKPLVYGAIYQYEGQVAVWNLLNADGTRSPHYRDIFPEVNTLQIPDCADGGVIPTLAGIIGCMQATEAIKIITGIGEPLSGKMLLLDVQTMHSQVVNTGRASNVPVTMLAKAVEIPLISIDELKRESGNEGILLVDVRTPEEHNAYNMGGINIPLVEIENSLHLFGNGKRIVMYCASGKRSMQAAKFIKSKMPGVTITSLEGGIKNLLL